jgi:hypothetical protein
MKGGGEQFYISKYIPVKDTPGKMKCKRLSTEIYNKFKYNNIYNKE